MANRSNNHRHGHVFYTGRVEKMYSSLTKRFHPISFDKRDSEHEKVCRAGL